MAVDSLRFYETFFAYYNNYWDASFGAFSNHHKTLTKEYVNMGCVTTDYSSATLVHEFLYPHHIKKTYFIEGIITGQVTYAAYLDDGLVEKYKVTLCKVHENNQKDELFTTGWKTVNVALTWDVTYNIGQDIVLSFEIDAWQKEKLSEKERLFLRIETQCNEYTVLWHSNDAKWEDVRIDVPFKL